MGAAWREKAWLGAMRAGFVWKQVGLSPSPPPPRCASKLLSSHAARSERGVYSYTADLIWLLLGPVSLCFRLCWVCESVCECVRVCLRVCGVFLFHSRPRNAMATQNNQDYFRSVSSESTTYMMVPANSRKDSPSKLWIAMVVIVVVVLQIASTTGLFVYLNMSLSKVSSVFFSLKWLYSSLLHKNKFALILQPQYAVLQFLKFLNHCFKQITSNIPAHSPLHTLLAQKN